MVALIYYSSANEMIGCISMMPLMFYSSDNSFQISVESWATYVNGLLYGERINHSLKAQMQATRL